MPKESMTVYFSAKDGLSPVLTLIGEKTRALDKETQQLEQSYAALQKANESLVKKKASLEKQLVEVNAAVKEAKKSFKELGDEASSNAYDKACEQQQELRTQIKETSAAIQENEKIYKSNIETIRKSIQFSDQSDSSGKLLKGLVAGQVGSLLSSSLGGLAEATLTSAIGTPAASLISDAISNTITGAAAGAAFGLPGILVGAGVGAISGAISGSTTILSSRDDAFKSYYQEAAQTAMDEQAEIITSGSGIAGSREQTRMAFTQRFGSDEAADTYLERVKTMATSTNYSYDEITGYSKLLLNTYDGDKTLSVLQTLSDASAGLNLDSSDVNMFISSLSRMRTTGKATQEYLNYFSERGVDVYQALADATGADKSDIAGMVTKGSIGGADAAEAILTYIDETYGGLSDKLATTYDAMVDNLADAEADMEAMAGEGYNEARKEGIAAQLAWLTNNDELEEAYKAIGAWQADLENQKEEFIRKAMDAMMESDEYQTAQAEGDAAEMGKLIMQAKVQGMNAYNASEGAQLALEAELALAGAIRDDTASDDAYWDAGYKKSQEYSKGLMAGLVTEENVSSILERMSTAGLGGAAGLSASGFAYGLDYVPYDGFPAVLHQGERVLTAGEARTQDSGGINVTIQVAELCIREEADVERIVAELVEQLELARMAG